MSRTVLVLGASGRFGGAAAHAFHAAGWEVRRFDRSRDRLPDAALGADVIVNGWNPPYGAWADTLPGLTEQVIAAAKASGATVIQAANVYVYGDRLPAVLGPDTPHAATNPLGRLRIEMEAALRASGVQVLLLRAGDFIGPEPSGNWFDRVIAAKLDRNRLVWPGDPDVAHAWAWLPDLGRAAVALAERRETLGRFEDIGFPGYTLSGREIAALIGRARGREPEIKRMSWLPVRLAAPFWKDGRGLLEMRYLWDRPHRIDGARLDAIAQGFATTPPEQAFAEAMKGHGYA